MSCHKLSSEALLKRIIALNDSDDVYELLMRFYRGFPISNLKILLKQEDKDLAGTGLFIASELGHRSLDLLPHVLTAMHGGSQRARSDALDVILLCAQPHDYDALKMLVEGLDDAHGGVRYTAVRHMAATTLGQLEGMVAATNGSLFEPLLRWLIDVCQDPTVQDEVIPKFDHSDAITRRVALVAALRLYHTAPKLLWAASTSSDPEIQDIALALV